MRAMNGVETRTMSGSGQRRALWAAALLLCGLALTATVGTAFGQDFLKPDQAFSHQESATEDGRLKITWQVAPGYYLYRSRIDIKGAASPVADVEKPAGKLYHDEYFGDQHIYEHDVSVIVTPGGARTLKLTWQGCAKAGLCYPPRHDTVDVGRIDGVGAVSEPTGGKQAMATFGASQGGGQASDQALAARLANGSTAWTLLVFFGLGLLLAFTPCVLPMLPILSGVIVGAGARGKRGFALSLAFVLPMALTYAVLGVAAALAGANLQAMLQTPAVLGAFAAVFVLLAAAMFGAFELQLPAFLRDRLNRASAKRRGGHVGGAAGMGVISAVLVGPCMTAPLAGALLYIAESGDAMLGGLALLSLGLGMGVPLLVVGTLGAQFMPRPGAWMNGVKAAFGFILLGTALWMIGRVLPAPIVLGLWGVLLVAVAVTLAVVARRTAKPERVRGGPIVAGTLAVVIGLWGVFMVTGAAGGADNPMRPLAFLKGGATQVAEEHSGMQFTVVRDLDTLNRAVKEAGEDGRWTVVDFYADWCVSCKVIDRTVFGNDAVHQKLADARLLRPDVTADNAASRRLMHKLGVVGPPTILFIGPNGEERRGARVVGELSAAEFLEHWHTARALGSASLQRLVPESGSDSGFSALPVLSGASEYRSGP
jgi:thiol:disulfide interchange protein DsbD